MKKNIGIVINTFSAKKSESGLPRPQVDSLNVIYGYGVQNDKFAGKDESKRIMIVGKKAYEIAQKKGINLQEGSLGENILLDFNPHDYDIGTIFKIGSVVLQITQNCTMCKHLSLFNDSLPFLVKECRGMYCKILDGGIIKKNDKVDVLMCWRSRQELVS